MGGAQFITEDGEVYECLRLPFTYPPEVFTCPRIAAGAGRGPRLVLGHAPCSAPTIPSSAFVFRGNIDDFVFAGQISSGVMVSASLSIADLVADALGYATDVLDAGSAIMDDMALVGSINSASGLTVNLLLSDLVLDATTGAVAYLTGDTSIEHLVIASTSSNSGQPAPDFGGLRNWDVIRGTVDLCGMGPNGETDPVATDVRPGNGMYLDLVGTDGDSDGFAVGKIRSKQTFSFVAGRQYRLSFYLCSYTGDFGYYVDVSIGNSGEIVAPTRFVPPSATFPQFDIIWTQIADGAGPIIFDHEIIAGASGILLDRVLLEDTTAGESLFYDDFDFENPS